MKLGLLFIGDGRRAYLDQAVASVFKHVTHPVTARMMINDEADPAYCASLDAAYPEYHIVHTGRRGMAGAVQAGFDLALSYDVDACLWIEEDFTVDAPLPIRDAAYWLDHDRALAQILFQRQPISDAEVAGGSVLAGMGESDDRGPYSVHSHIFSLNPCLIPRRVLALGYDTGNEAGMTEKLTSLTYKFGVWNGPQLVTHIGTERSAGWHL